MVQARVVPIAAAVAPSESPASPQRRVLVQWLAAAAALSAGGCTRTPVDRVISLPASPLREVRDDPRHYATVIDREGWAQGVQVATREGRPIKVEGLADHWASLGGTDAPTQATMLALWDPDRSTTVMRRDAAANATPSSWTNFSQAWNAHAGRDDAVHVLTPRFTSPTLGAQLAALLLKRPGSVWYRHEGVDSSAQRQGAQTAFGRLVQVVQRADAARLIVSFGDDPFSTPGTGVRFAADWAARRERDELAGQPPARLVALEVAPGLFGARADERQALAPVDIEAVLWRVAHGLDDSIGAVEGLRPDLDRLALRIVELIQRHRGETLICPAPWLASSSHALVHRLHARLGAASVCAMPIEAPDQPAGMPAPQSLLALVQAVDRGEVRTLVVLGGNPAYNAAAEYRFTEALRRVPFSAHLGLHDDETSRACHWHLPTGHAFEQWSDLRAADGSVSVAQPVIAPLYDTRSAHQLLALMAGHDVQDDGQSLVRAQFERHAGSEAQRWQDCLRRGAVAGSESPGLSLPEPIAPSPPVLASLASGCVWGLFERDAAIGDGTDANNGWLQELPRPFTSITWGNAAVLGPATARAFGLQSGDTVRLCRADDAGGAGVEAPVWVQTQHAENTVSVALGHGRRAAGRIGDGVGVDAAALRSADGRPIALRIERMQNRAPHVFARVQLEDDQHGRELARRIAHGAAFTAPPDLPSLYDPADTLPIRTGAAWAMAIDLDACIGCNACSVACQSENNIPVVGPDEVRVGRTMHWIRVDAYRDEHGATIHQPVPCMHCENAPCELVCPVGATVHDSEGLNVQVYNRCIGTRFCSNNCPYKVRRFNFRQYADVASETARLLHNPDVTVRSRGVMEKCNYCVQRISRARRDVLAGAAPAATLTACQSACPTRAIRFGDLNDPDSEVSHARRSARHYAMLEELGTRPRTTYLARLAPLPEGEA